MKNLRPTPAVFQGDNDQALFFEEIRELLQSADAVADLNQTISASPTQAEVQAISDKVDELLTALRSTRVLNT